MSIEVDFENFKKGRVPSEVNNFGAMVFLMVAKADRENREKLRFGFPRHVEMYEKWMMEGADEDSSNTVERRGWDG